MLVYVPGVIMLVYVPGGYHAGKRALPSCWEESSPVMLGIYHPGMYTLYTTWVCTTLYIPGCTTVPPSQHTATHVQTVKDGNPR